MDAKLFAVPFGQVSDFVLANTTSVFNFYPSLENAAADADRANGLKCYTCSRPFTDAEPLKIIYEDRKARLCPDCNFNSFLMCEMLSGSYTNQYVRLGRGETASHWQKVVDARDRSTWMTYESLTAIAQTTKELQKV